MQRTCKYGPSGVAVACPVPDADQVRIEDIAHALGQIPRFGGLAREPWTVAQHSLEVGRLCMQAAGARGLDPIRAGIEGLSHDFHEAYVGDVISPLKRLLGQPWEDVDHAAVTAVRRGLGLGYWSGQYEEYRDLVEWADAEMLVSDAVRWCYPGTYYSRVLGEFVIFADAHGMQIPKPHLRRFGAAPCWGWREARDALLGAWRALQAGEEYFLHYE